MSPELAGAALPLPFVWVASEYPPHVFGGLGTHVADMTTALTRQGIRVDLVVPERVGYQIPPDGLRLVQVPVPESHSNTDYWLRFSLEAARAIARSPSRGGLVHCHDWMTAVVGVAISPSCLDRFVLTVHLPQVRPVPAAMEAIGMAAADGVIVNSTSIAEELASRRRRARTIVIPNGVDVERYAPFPPAEGAAAQFLFVGRLVTQKGVDWLLEAFAVAAERLPTIRLVIVGEGPHSLYLLRLARHLGLAGRVAFAGWKTGADLLQEYRSATAVVVPSWYEPFGLVALEAMACARPVLSARTGGLQDFIVDGVNGFAVDPGDYLRLAARLVQVASDRDLRTRMGIAARETALGYTWDSVASRTVDLYREVLGKRRRTFDRGFRHQLDGLSGAVPANEVEEVRQLVDIVEAGKMFVWRSQK